MIIEETGFYEALDGRIVIIFCLNHNKGAAGYPINYKNSPITAYFCKLGGQCRTNQNLRLIRFIKSFDNFKKDLVL